MSFAILHLKAKPNGRLNQVQVAADGGLTVRLKVSAHAGQANAELVAVLAKVFGVSKSSVTIITGHTAPFKKVRLDGLSEQECQQVLARYQT
ncbi:DUF167 domain-containing protein [Hymenobacter sp. BT188]|uniref:DUF167 domain-containing protein n=1 Tax=Hymenobacter sp. BT188 TaxID=2763504 RepID=UPI0016512112|nr:DUF167 domain-containing protein [Hymenobacter sp. BT188]MBC6607068.1 DUF167 domain-containing protein [Hymenobacter sp. BT188]